MIIQKKTSLDWMLRFIYAQLVVTLISIPFLIAWGLPLSYVSPISNLIFTPVISLFIILSTLIFICELISIPSTLFTIALTYTADLWNFILNYGSNSWLFGLVCHSQLILWLCVGGTIVLLLLTHHHPLNRKILLFTAYLSICIFYFHHMTPVYNGSTILQHNKSSLTITRTDGITNLIDSGLLTRRTNQHSWAVFTLRPALLQFTGSLSIDTITCPKINKSTLITLATLLDYFHINKIIIAPTKANLRQLKPQLEALTHKCKHSDATLSIIQPQTHNQKNQTTS